MGSSEVIQHMLKVALGSSGPVEFSETNRGRNKYIVQSNGIIDGALPVLQGTDRTTVGRIPQTHRRVSKRNTRRHVAKGWNAQLPPVKAALQDTNTGDGPGRALPTRLPRLPTETCGVPTVREHGITHSKSDKSWATSWADERSRFKPRQGSVSNTSKPAPIVRKTQRKSKLNLENDDSAKTIAAASNIEHSTSELESRKTILGEKENSGYSKPRPFLERKKSKTGFFSTSGDFILTEDIDPEQKPKIGDRGKHVTRSRPGEYLRASNGSKKRAVASKLRSKKPPRRKKPKLRRPTLVVSKKTLAQERSLASVYGNSSFKLQRHVSFLKLLGDAQRCRVEEEERTAVNESKKRVQSLRRQRSELKEIRDRFDQEQVKRFRKQYVSWKSVETDRLGRKSEVYGLPDNIYDDRYERTLKEPNKKPAGSRRKPKSFRQVATWVKNIKTFEKLLNPRINANLEKQLTTQKKLMLEGRDTVELETERRDLTKPKKTVKVARVIGSARRLLNASDELDAISEVSSLDEIDHEMANMTLSDRQDYGI